jgi:hypothetical protein
MRSIVRDLLALSENYVRPANQNAPAGGIESKYMTCLISTVIGSRGTETSKDVPGTLDIMRMIDGQRKATATLQAFGEGAFDLLVSLNALLDCDWAQWLFSQQNFGLVTRRGPSDLTTIIPAELWQRRAILELDFYFIAHAEIRVPCFGSFTADTYIDLDGHNHFEYQVPTTSKE